MKRRYLARRAFNAAFDGVRIARCTLTEWWDSDDSVLCVCSGVVRVLIPVIFALSLALMLSVVM